MFVAAVLYFLPKEVALAWLGPLLIIFVGLLIFRPVISSPWRFGLPIYGLSIGGAIFADIALGFSNQAAAELAGITIPLCSTVLIGIGHIVASLTSKRICPRGLERIFTTLGGIALGAFAGALLGAVIYYLEDGDVLDFFTDHADALIITTSTLLGMCVGGYFAATLGDSAMESKDGKIETEVSTSNS
jgi:hypothetical protein